ncbi:hypothetical protein [Streptomyces sp. NPDC018031]|uniref:hypothetical protein n=1 Tax=Streptomyces sp. NPDC018031 TaxID=3365033 RepID=UPI0037BCDD7D
MTQSGQGNEPQPAAVPPAHEGVVLPPHGDQWAPEQQAAPAGGQPWGQPWGPEGGPQHGGPQQPSGQALPQPPAPGQLPPAQQPYGQLPPAQQPYGQLPPSAQPGQAPYGGGPQPGPSPYDPQPGPSPYDPQYHPGAAAPGGQAPQQPYGGPPQPAPQQPQPYGQPQGLPYGQPQPGAAPQPGLPGGPAGAPQAQPPAQPSPQLPRLQPHPPQGSAPGGQAPAEQTRVLRPITADTPPPAGSQGFDAEATQLIPPTAVPAPGAADSEATQLIAPVPGATGAALPLPPENAPAPQAQAQPSAMPLPPETAGRGRRRRPESPAESTTQLRRITGPPAGAGAPGAAEETQVLPGPVPAHGGAPGHGGPQPPHPGGAPYAIRPGRPEDRQPPAEFDGLFRADGAGAAPGAQPADSTQQLPLYDDAAQPPAGPGYGHGGGHGGDDGGGPARRRKPAVLIGIVVAGCAIAGLAAGAAISAGGDDGDDKKKDDAKSTAPTTSASPEPTPTADPVETQAKALDQLLADSNDSRASVIKAVGNIRTCKDLTNAAKDLRAAAGQRNGLVTRLSEISVDKLPDHAKLTAALNKAWKSSAAADNHYAAWADQVKGKKGCHKGKARTTRQVGLAERASGEATKAKEEAATLWNGIASRYKLTQRQAGQL